MRLVVIGGVAAGLSAAARARRLDRRLEITVLEKGEHISYAACGLPYYVEGRFASMSELEVYTPGYFARERNITVRTAAPAAQIVHSRREVLLAGGESVPYDRLVIATGARVDRRGIPGSDQPHVFRLHTYQDGLDLRRYLYEHRPMRAAVIGAGYIGLEVVEALRTNGIQVTLFQRDGSLMGRTGGAVADAIQHQLKRFHVDYRPGAPVTKIETGAVNGVPCELVVVAAGMKPNVELAVEAGIEVGRTGAIAVTERMETNLTGVFAAGDCAEATHLVTGRPVWIPLGTTANKMGRVAGANAAGARERFAGIAGTSIVGVLGLGVAVTGLSEADARAEGFDAATATIRKHEKPRYFRGTISTVELTADRRTGKLLGGAVIGHDGVAGRINVIAAALQAGMTVEDFEELDLAYAPPYATTWDPLLIAAQQLRKML